MNRPPTCTNGSPYPVRTGVELSRPLKEMLKPGLSLLWRGFEYSRDLGTDREQFAVDREFLYGTGLSDIDLRWLIARGYIRPARPAARSPGDGSNRETRHQSSPENVGFILTEMGVTLAMQVLSSATQVVSNAFPANGNGETIAGQLQSNGADAEAQKPKPSWDRDRKELRFRGMLIKQFRWSATNQETILMAFEEENWPVRIDDPLPRKLNQEPKSRLHDTIKCLNRNHKQRLIRFIGDGTGEGVAWSLINDTGLDNC
jgi:hypothetical protein